jgi:hypothetical protein
MFDADADAGVEFGPDPLSGQSVPSGNAFVETGFSQAQTMSNLSNLSQAPSMSVRAEADTFSGVIGGGSGPTSFFSDAGGHINILYFVEISGPKSNTPVPVQVIENGSASITGNFASTGYTYNAQAGFTVDDGPLVANNGVKIIQGQTFVGSSGTTLNFTTDKSVDFTANKVYEVIMNVSASAEVTDNASESALSNLVVTASIDPSFQITDPDFSDYSILFSSGIANAPSATPLPAALPLFAGGLCFVGYLARRKKHNSASIAAA